MNKLLLIANYKYNNGLEELHGIIKELEKVKNTFGIMEYEITELINYSYEGLAQQVEKYLSKIERDDTVVIYYTGHGSHYDGHNFVICPDSSLNISKSAEASFYESLYKMYDLNIILNHNFLTDKVLLVSNACRNKESADLGEASLDNSCSCKTIISQIYATSIYDSAYDSTFFYESFCVASLRYLHSVSDIYESICCNKINIDKKNMQNPIYIKGEKDFCISNIFNRDVERQFYQDVIDIYRNYVLQSSMNCVSSSNDMYEELHEIAEINGPKNYVLEIIEKYLFRDNKYEFISCLIQLPIYSLTIKPDKFHIQGKNGCFMFENDGMYDYEQCRQKIENEGREIYKGVKLLSEHIFYINPYETSDEKWFELRIENADKKELASYFKNNERMQDVINSFYNKKSIIISASNRTDSIGFLRSLVHKCIAPEDRILFLRYMENIQSHNEVDHVFINEIWTDILSQELYKRKICDGGYKWVIISLHSSLEAFADEENLLDLENVLKLAKKSNVPILIITNFLPDALKIFRLTKRFYKYADKELDLECEGSLENTYVSKFVNIIN